MEEVMRRMNIRSLALGSSLFAAGWLGGQTVVDADAVPPRLVGSAAAQTDRSPIDPGIHALMYGVATIAVDTEAAALRINDLADRHSALERRVAQLEAQVRR